MGLKCTWSPILIKNVWAAQWANCQCHSKRKKVTHIAASIVSTGLKRDMGMLALV